MQFTLRDAVWGAWFFGLTIIAVRCTSQVDRLMKRTDALHNSIEAEHRGHMAEIRHLYRERDGLLERDLEVSRAELSRANAIIAANAPID